YDSIVDYFKKKGSRILEPKGASDPDLGAASLVVLGPNQIVPVAPAAREAGFDLTVRENPWSKEKVIGVFQAKSKREVDDAFPKIFHYGKYSELAFDQGRNVWKAAQAGDRGTIREVSKPAAAVDVSALKDLPDVIGKVADRKIVYVGESHDRFSHHVMELEVIKGLQGKGKKLAIGMEMFQRPSQGALDDFIAGKFDEKEMLRRTEYFRRWKFDYRLYRPILEFARARKIPVVALNARTEIVEKVARGGLDSLSEEEKKELPSGMDFSDHAYRERLEKVFQEHKSFPGGKFDYFLAAQVIWDETMAQSVDEFLRQNPETQMVALAGAGHLAFGSGIPKRAFRRGGYSYAVLLNDTDPEKGIADYILYPGPVAFEESPKMGVFLGEENGQVVIQGFSHESPAEKAGMKKGDVILSLDLAPVQKVEDARIEMAFREKEKAVKVRVLRKEGPGNDQEMQFEVVPGK
ncbi:MAG TPA: ChaN family lipoprotein, partial [Thermodesulfobacteriota bacterium]|nr:ChaN family lipoprotein [Thermodesulfobacteriota bacterium]